MAVKLANLKAKLKAKRKPESTPTKKKKAKVKAADVSADDGLPWDEDSPHSVGPTKVSKKEVRRIASEAREYGVRAPTSNEDDEEDTFEEDNTAFAKQMGKVAKRVNDKHQPYNSPATQELVTREALASILLLLPGYAATAKSSNGERAAYAYSNQVNLARELMNDLRAMSSTDALADRVIQEAVRPLYLGLVNYLINELSNVRSKVNSGNTLEGLKRTMNDALNNLMLGVKDYGQENLDAATDKARQSLRN